MQARVSLWRQTPLAIFPVALGFMGLGLAWRNAAMVSSIPSEIGELTLGISFALFLFFTASYGMKVFARPSVVLEDIKTPPAKAGLAAISMGLMVSAAILTPVTENAIFLLMCGVALQILIAFVVFAVSRKTPPETRGVTPFLLLPYVGLIVAPLSTTPLGFGSASEFLALVSFVAFLGITVQYIPRFRRMRPPQPLRPSLVIFLAPLALFAMAAGQLGYETVFAVIYWLANLYAVILLVFARWLTEGGWTPVWGSFTFPTATFASLQAVALSIGYSDLIPRVLLFGALFVATPLVLYIVYKAFNAWVRGELAKKSGAATA